jgi:peroxiredoxin
MAGLQAPDFSLLDLSGKTFKLSTQLGKPMVIFFGTTWCPACRAEMPYFKNLYDKYSARGLKFIYIDINESPSRVARFARENSFPYIVLTDIDGAVAQDYNIVGVPTMILLDEKGLLRGIVHRVRDLPVEALFSAAPSSQAHQEDPHE